MGQVGGDRRLGDVVLAGDLARGVPELAGSASSDVVASEMNVATVLRKVWGVTHS